MRELLKLCGWKITFFNFLSRQLTICCDNSATMIITKNNETISSSRHIIKISNIQKPHKEEKYARVLKYRVNISYAPNKA